MQRFGQRFYRRQSPFAGSILPWFPGQILYLHPEVMLCRIVLPFLVEFSLRLWVRFRVEHLFGDLPRISRFLATRNQSRPDEADGQA